MSISLSVSLARSLRSLRSVLLGSLRSAHQLGQAYAMHRNRLDICINRQPLVTVPNQTGTDPALFRSPTDCDVEYSSTLYCPEDRTIYGFFHRYHSSLSNDPTFLSSLCHDFRIGWIR